MPLESGARLGPYEIIAPIAGLGADEVYKASDTEQSRTVVLRLLPLGLSQNAESRQRLERELQAMSALNHPHISTPYGIRTEGETDFLVTEFAEGETLAQRLERGPLPLDEAVSIGLAVADALNRAHRAGLIHRGLRPTNILLTDEGPRLLDFGLSLRATANDLPLVPGSEVRSKATLSEIPDDILRYMAPEQVNAGTADARSDVFAYGAIFYEMVTGEKAFDGRNRPMLIAAIASLDPYPLSKSQPASPPMLDHIVQRCLAKDPDNRWQTAHDLLIQLRWITESGDAFLIVSRAQKKRERRVLVLLAALAFILTVVAGRTWISFGSPNADTQTLQFRVPVAGLSSSDIAMSPDGKQLAIVAKPNTMEASWLFVRSTGTPEFRKLTGTEDASQPFWSPDSRSIGFFAGGRLKRVDAGGGAPKDLGAAPGFAGGAWSAARVILFGSAKGLYRVSDEGGTPELITALEKQQLGHFWPSFLDAEHYAYLAWSADAANRGVFTGTIGSKDTKKFIAVDSNVAFAGSGYVLFHREATLFAQLFDAKTLTPTGDPLHIADRVEFNPANGHGNFDAAHNGDLIYFQSGEVIQAGVSRGGVVVGNDVQFAWVDRKGKTLSLVGPQGRFGEIDATQDGKLVVMSRQDASAPNSDVWTLDWQRSAWYRLTQAPSDNFSPVFSPDGNRVAFTTLRKGNADIYVKNANGSSEDMPLVETSASEYVEDWSKNGEYLFYKSGENSDIYAFPLNGDKKPFPVVVGPFQKDEPQLSYDGKWLAYTTNQSGSFQVYVRSFPSGDQIVPISPGGGGQPRWSRDGKELFYRSDSVPMVVKLTPGSRLIAASPETLFGALVNGAADREPTRHNWVVSPDGQRFLTRVALGQGGGTGIPFAIAATTNNLLAQQGFVSSGLTVIRNWRASVQGVTR